MLNLLLWAPLAAGVLLLALPRGAARWVSLAGALVALALAIGLVLDFDAAAAGLQQVVDESWIPDLGVRYQLGIDGISVFLILLTALLWAGATAFSGLRGYPEDGRSKLYYFLLGLGETAALGAFCAQDLLLFVLFFDLMLIPFFFLIGAFGSGDRIAATTKMLVYTLVGSLLMLVGAIATAILAAEQSGGELTFSIPTLRETLLSSGSQEWIFCFFAAAFLVKMPAFPIHGWMPDAYRAAPLPVVLLLSGVLSKVGAYGFLRVVLPIFPEATSTFQELVMVVAVVSILYGSVMAFTQTNVRLIAGYSSIAQLGFITLGVFSLRPDGADGAVLQMVNHGLVVAAIFVVIAILHERTRTEDLTEMGGQAKRAPVLAALFLVVTMATLAIPGSANFIGEFYILNGAFQSKIAFAFVAAIGVVLAAFYALRLYQRTMHDRLPEGAESRELSLRDGVV
ncbi:MAG: NADH-quinone oxidoreductase subunit M, partial [Actinomycetota bacterium]|nr:NADH-quinone oxidoreductase subunit M [Actinomycetota bacterium]